jgi:hypothetical protein
MYKSYTAPDIHEDINNRLEFLYLKDVKKTPGTLFEATGNQLFSRNYINPWTSYTRCINKSGTGIGKTYLALLTAKSFIDEGRPVIIIGYQQERFYDEMIHRPELGFVTRPEVTELDRLQKLMSSGNPDSVKAFKDYRTKLRKRNKFITFFGYGEFTNRIFNMGRLDTPQVNYELIESFRYGFIICDEIHNAYNAIEQNNWGKTIQFVINVLGPQVHLLLLSATPLTNSTEITDFLGLLADSPGIKIGKLKFEYHNRQKEVIDQVIDFSFPSLTHLKLSKEPSDTEITDRIKGKVLFVPDIGIESIPKRYIFGDAIDGIKYLKFIRVEMSSLQEKYTRLNLHNHQLRDIGGLVDELPDATTLLSTSTGDATVNEFGDAIKSSPLILDDDEYGAPSKVNELSLLYANEHISKSIRINTIKTSDGIYLTGEGLKQENLMKYSPKYCKMLDLIYAAVPGKILVYHHYVHNTGILTLQEIFRENGIIGDTDTPNEFTKCAICCKPKSMHSANSTNREYDANRKYEKTDLIVNDPTKLYNDKNFTNLGNHSFTAMRFISIHSKLDKVTTDRNKNKYNSISNIHGYEYRILLGSRKIKEGMDFKGIKTQIILGLPTNMSIMLQVFGRAARTMSHDGLPHDQWFVNTYILICQYNKRKDIPITENDDFTNFTPEEIDYKHKVDDYSKIQHYDLVINRSAIDAHIMNTPSKLDTVSDLGLRALSYTLPKLHIDKPVQTTTYYALERYKEELITIRALINKAFGITNVWNINTLWEFIRGIKATPNPQYFDKKNYIIVLKSYSGVNIAGEYVIQSDKEVEAFARLETHFNEVKMMRVNAIKESFLIDVICDRIDKLSGSKYIRAVDVFDIYESYHIDIHVRLLERALVYLNVESIDKVYVTEYEKIDPVKTSKVVRFYAAFFKLLKYKDVGMTSDNESFIGYINDGNYKYIIKNGWKLYPSVDNVRENSIVVGMFSPEMYFKLRDPVEVAKVSEKTKVIDQRKLQRGANCLTRNKTQLLAIMKKLDIEDDSDRIYNICDTIKRELVDRESKKKDGLKWVYFHS